MSGASIAALGTAAALYWWANCAPPDDGHETHTGVHSAPQSWREDVYFFAEGLRYTFRETLGRWRTADLLIGLAYLARKEGEEHPAADIARQARPMGERMGLEDLDTAIAELRVVERFMRYCFVMRERKLQAQRDMFRILGIADSDIILHEMRAGVLKPSFVLVRDAELQAVVLSIRGTHSFRDAFTSLTGASKPHHLVDTNGVVLGYSHFGMLAAARWIKQQTLGAMEAALADNPGYELRIVGHSLGGGTAALLTMMLRERGGPCGRATCLALACPSCMTLELAASCADYVTTVVNAADVIPTVSPGAADRLREEVMRSSWFVDFRRDVRSSTVVRAVESGLRGVGSATWSATSWTTQKLSACYPRRRTPGGRTLKRRNSDDWSGQALEGDAAAQLAGGGGSEFGVASAADEAQAFALGQDGVASPTLAAVRSATNASVQGLFQTMSPASGGSGVGRPGSPTPAGLGGSSLAPHPHGHHHAGAGQQGQRAAAAAWGRRLVGWGANVGSLTGRGAAVLGSGISSGSRAAVRSTSGLLQRVWWQSCRLPAACGPGDQAQLEGGEGSEGARLPPGSPPDGMCMDEGSQQGAEGDEESGDGMDPAESAALLRELSLRMSEVEAAVHDAEEVEAREGDDATVPSVIRPGAYGTAGVVSPTRRQLSSPAKQQDAKWRRAMYPAGRILHLVPAYLVDQPPPASDQAAPPSSIGMDSSLGEGGEAGGAEAREGEGEGSDSGGSSSDYGSPSFAAAPHSPPPSVGAAGGAPSELPPSSSHRGQRWVHVEQPAGEEVEAAEGSGSSAQQQQQARRRGRVVTNLGFQGEAGEVEEECDEDGVWVQRSEGSQPGASGSGRQQSQEDFVLLDWVPQQAYGRIKLCRRMLADHFIPNYLMAMESAQRRLAERRAQLVHEREAAAAAEALGAGSEEMEL